MNLEITVVNILGNCPVFTLGDSFILKDGFILDTAESCKICMHSLASLLPYYNVLQHDVDPFLLGLASKEGMPARIQCLDPCDYTGGGTVIFEIKRIGE
jgi:uncharacterized repeat protein (TIGR04076 family)